jgi:hypothetical protein
MTPPSDWTAIVVFAALFAVRDGHGLSCRALAQGRPHAAGGMGTGRTALRHGRHLVSAGGRSLHRLHLHRRADAHVRLRRDRLLRRALYDLRLSDPVHGFPAIVVRLACERLCDGSGFRSRPVRQQAARACRRRDRNRRHHALYRAAACGDGRGHRRPRHPRGIAARYRVRDSGRLHLFERTARARDDRGGQGYADLCNVIAALVVIPHELGGYAKIFASVPPAKSAPRRPPPTISASRAVTRRWHSALRSHCFSIRMRSRGCSARPTAT